MSAGAVRVLFLDIDGVVHPAKEVNSLGPSKLYMQVGPFGWLPHLAKVLEAHPDVALVVHSSWRETFTLDEIREMYLELGDRSVDVTPPGSRYESILEWLQQRPTVSYLILDDDASEFPTPKPSELVICDPNKGLSDLQVLTAVRQWLEGPEPIPSA